MAKPWAHPVVWTPILDDSTATALRRVPASPREQVIGDERLTPAYSTPRCRRTMPDPGPHVLNGQLG